MEIARIHARQKTCSARRADGTLAVGVRKCGALAQQLVDNGRAHMLVAKSADRVETLLVCADPENVGWPRRRQQFRSYLNDDCGEGGANVMFASGNGQPQALLVVLQNSTKTPLE